MARRPRVNLQEFKNGKAKPYQVKQLLTAVEKVQSKSENDHDETL